MEKEIVGGWLELIFYRGVAKYDLLDLVNRKPNEDIVLQLEVDPKHPKESVKGYISVKFSFC